jgi:hypothetical protein
VGRGRWSWLSEEAWLRICQNNIINWALFPFPLTVTGSSQLAPTDDTTKPLRHRPRRRTFVGRRLQRPNLHRKVRTVAYLFAHPRTVLSRVPCRGAHVGIAQHILTIVFFLSLAAAQALNTSPTLAAYNITHVLSICPEHIWDGTPTHLAITDVHDTEHDQLLLRLPETCAFIQAALDAHGRILVHCAAGVSRSSTLVAAYRTY